jgi:hypothetical protein
MAKQQKLSGEFPVSGKHNKDQETSRSIPRAKDTAGMASPVQQVPATRETTETIQPAARLGVPPRETAAISGQKRISQPSDLMAQAAEGPAAKDLKFPAVDYPGTYKVSRGGARKHTHE